MWKAVLCTGSLLIAAMIVCLLPLISGKNGAEDDSGDFHVERDRIGSVALIGSTNLDDDTSFPGYSVLEPNGTIVLGLNGTRGTGRSHRMTRWIPGDPENREVLFVSDGWCRAAVSSAMGNVRLLCGTKYRAMGKYGKDTIYNHQSSAVLVESENGIPKPGRVLTVDKDTEKSMFWSATRDDQDNFWIGCQYSGNQVGAGRGISVIAPDRTMVTDQKTAVFRVSSSGDFLSGFQAFSEAGFESEMGAVLWDTAGTNLVVVGSYKASISARAKTSGRGLFVKRYTRDGQQIFEKKLPKARPRDNEIAVGITGDGKIWINYVDWEDWNRLADVGEGSRSEYVTSILLDQTTEIVVVNQIQCPIYPSDVSTAFSCNGAQCFVFAGCNTWLKGGGAQIRSVSKNCSSVEMFVYGENGALIRTQTLGVFRDKWVGLCAGRNSAHPHQPFLIILHDGRGVIWSDKGQTPVAGGKNVLTCVEIPVE